MRRPLAAAGTMLVLLVLSTALPGCGDDGGSAFEQDATTTVASTSTTAAPTSTAAPTTIPAVSTTTTGGGGSSALGGLVAGAVAEGAGADAPVAAGPEEECLTSGLVQAIGAERFAELDALAADATDLSVVFGAMTESELDALVGVIGDCIDVEGLLTEEMTGDQLSPEAVACFAASLSEEDTLKSLIKAMIGGEDPATNPEFMAVVIPIMTEDCVEPMEAMLVDEFTAAGISEQGAACVADRFLRGGLFESLLNTMLSGTDFPTDPELQGQMMAAFTDCLTPEELANLGG